VTHAQHSEGLPAIGNLNALIREAVTATAAGTTPQQVAATIADAMTEYDAKQHLTELLAAKVRKAIGVQRRIHRLHCRTSRQKCAA
jgi:hypothetical protein